MRHLNYTHLLYFWTVAREGSIVAAARVLHLTPQTISGQLKLLEAAIGDPLFNRVGRGLALTDTGRVVEQYADEIFALGAELTQRVKSRQALQPTTLNVGILDAIPKLVALRIVAPCFEQSDPLKVVCHEGGMERLLAELAVHRLDLILSDRPTPVGLNVKAFNHLLGESSIGFFVHRSRAAQFHQGFPDCLDAAPMLLPATDIPLRRALDEWFDREGISPHVQAEFDDSALLKAFGEQGLGVFPAPMSIADAVASMYHCELLGTVPGLSESYYAISPERKLKHPMVMLITRSARDSVFAGSTQ